MSKKNLIKRWLIKIHRYILGTRFLPVMAGPLKGYLWSTGSSYDYIFGAYENPDTLKLFLKWLKPDTVFYDIGANVGFYSLTANTVINNGVIYAFEPMPLVRGIFEKHIELNKKLMPGNNINVFPFAVSDREGVVEFSNDSGYRDGNTYIKDSYVFLASDQKIKVACQSVDGFVEQGHKIPDIIKIDVEGAEFDVLLGAKKTLERFQPKIILSTHNCHLPGVQQKCVNFLKELGYRLQYMGNYNETMPGLDDYIAIHKTKI
jgi:FkbM family methyltransferase